MEDSAFLWQAITVASVLGNVVAVWLKVKNGGKANIVQPFEVVRGKVPATMDNVKVIHHRMDGFEERLKNLEEAREIDKQSIIDEIVKMREQSHEQFATLNRAIGRLEGAHMQD